MVGGAKAGWRNAMWLGGAPGRVCTGEETGWGVLVGEGEGAESCGIGGEVRGLGPRREWKRCVVIKMG